MDRIWKIACYLLFVVFCGSVASVCVQPKSDRPDILIVNKPQLWAEPARDAATVVLDWPAGRPVSLAKTLPDDEPTSHDGVVWRQVIDGEIDGWMPDIYLAPPPLLAFDGPIEHAPVDQLRGLPPDYIPEELVSVKPRYNDDIDYRLRPVAATAFKAMITAARNDRVTLYVASAYRPWKKQQSLYERALKRHGWTQQVVAKPGHSEHQLGTTVDLTDGELKTLLKPAFADTRAGRWLRENAPMHGFAQSFTKQNTSRTGIAPEPWHYRYWGHDLAPRKHFEALGEESIP